VGCVVNARLAYKHGRRSCHRASTLGKSHLTSRFRNELTEFFKVFWFFGVYDGHGGQNVAQYAGRRLHERLYRDPAFAKGEYAMALQNAFLGLDVDIRADPELANDSSGCTAITALISPDNHLYVANAGDSRAVLSTDGGQAVALSSDHKPGNELEAQRIFKAGGFVEFGRVNGNLALSRAIGDFEFKQNKLLTAEEQIVTAYPDICEQGLGPSDEFLVLACDGIWDVMSNQEVVTFIRRGLASRLPLQDVCERLMDRCLASESDLGGVGCDNMTVVIVGLLMGCDVGEWYRKASHGVEPFEGFQIEPISDASADEADSPAASQESQPSLSLDKKGPHGITEPKNPTNANHTASNT